MGSHILLLIFLLGIISASGFSTRYMEQVNSQANTLEIKGKVLNLQSIKEGKMMIITTGLSDYVITEIQNTSNGSIIFYQSKPLISMLWLGGFGVLGSLLVIIIGGKVREGKSN